MIKEYKFNKKGSDLKLSDIKLCYITEVNNSKDIFIGFNSFLIVINKNKKEFIISALGD